MMIKDWDKYKDKVYYDYLCRCGCGSGIEVKPWHKYRDSIPEYVYGHNKGFLNKHHTEEAKQKNREAHLGNLSPKKNKTYEEYYGEERAGEIKQKIRAAHEGTHHSEETKQKIRETETGKSGTPWSEETRKKIVEALVGRLCPEHSKRMKQFWADPEYREKQLKVVFKGLKLLPNKPEKFITKLLQRLLPDLWKYIGDGKDEDSIIAGKCPDFVCISQKKIIEYFGDYWHGEERTGIPNERHEQERINCFAKEGYQTLVIWEHELEDTKKLKKRILEFNYA